MNEEHGTMFEVVKNHEEQFSIWPSDRATPKGWSAVGMVGTKEECLEFIETVWIDMRPLSLRRTMDALDVAAHDSVDGLRAPSSAAATANGGFREPHRLPHLSVPDALYFSD